MESGGLHEILPTPVTGAAFGAAGGNSRAVCRRRISTPTTASSENHDHEDLPDVVDRGKERQPEQEDKGDNRIDDNRAVAQVRREEASHGDLVAAGPCQGPHR